MILFAAQVPFAVGIRVMQSATVNFKRKQVSWGGDGELASMADHGVLSALHATKKLFDNGMAREAFVEMCESEYVQKVLTPYNLDPTP
mgnify:CR=1 FL=1